MTTTLYKNFNLFDGTEDKVTDNAWFLVNDETGRLEKVGTGESREEADKTV